jgi:hypothetical protein
MERVPHCKNSLNQILITFQRFYDITRIAYGHKNILLKIEKGAQSTTISCHGKSQQKRMMGSTRLCICIITEEKEHEGKWSRWWLMCIFHYSMTRFGWVLSKKILTKAIQLCVFAWKYLFQFYIVLKWLRDFFSYSIYQSFHII